MQMVYEAEGAGHQDELEGLKMDGVEKLFV